MKKFFAVLLILVFALALSSCGFGGSMRENKLEYTTDKSDDNGYYSALNINLVSSPISSEQGNSLEYVLQIGIRKIFFGRTKDEIDEQTESAAQNVIENYGIDMEYLGYYELSPFSLLSTDYSDSDYIYLCFLLDSNGPKGSLERIESNFGFFYYEHKYVVNNSEWVSDLSDEIYSIVDESLNENFLIDPDAV